MTLQSIKELELDSPLEHGFERNFFQSILEETPTDILELVDNTKELHDTLLYADKDLAEDFKQSVCKFPVNRYIRYMFLGPNIDMTDKMLSTYKKYKHL